MHELSITQSIMDTVDAKMKYMEFKKVCLIRLKVGNANDYVPEVMQQYFDVMSEGTRYENARLEVEFIDGRDFYIENVEIED